MACAIAKNNGRAVARVGEIAESPDYSWKMKRRARDRGEAISYYEKGAALGNREAAAGFLRIALDPNYCSFCEDQGDLKFDRTKREAAGLLDKESGALSKLGRASDRESVCRDGYT